ncbi:HTH-type transcriptional regulator PuuR [Enhygromyxa salina]|uniref:HTH-type transcriptional regulator PuuR n=1 Tax=Enhygromyxa salina TaxID=215803 RepID=A0A2S9YE65_9BACT|nr:helix-turn-helix transcriptional regulator [Enhygromyxa salina]PRQ03417.1 HTH-type transcriptional regulator PuuR [Enhygromyxa salina]
MSGQAEIGGAERHRALLGHHLRRLRKARGLTQSRLAELSGLSVDTIRRLEHDDFSPSLNTMRKLAGGLDLRLSALFEAMDVREPMDPELAARGAMPRAASLGLFAEGFVAKTCSTPGTAAFWLRALGEHSGARRHDALHPGLLEELVTVLRENPDLPLSVVTAFVRGLIAARLPDEEK